GPPVKGEQPNEVVLHGFPPVLGPGHCTHVHVGGQSPGQVTARAAVAGAEVHGRPMVDPGSPDRLECRARPTVVARTLQTRRSGSTGFRPGAGTGARMRPQPRR